MPALTISRDEVRAIDAAAIEQLGIPGLVLMENAARGVADVIHREFAGVDRIVIACGFGNNGGDGLALARQLHADNVTADTLILRHARELAPDAQLNLQFLERSGVSVRDCSVDDFVSSVRTLSDNDLIVDCLLGTGVRGAVRAPFDTAISAINDSAAGILAVDLPSGMDCDTGRPCGNCVVAQRTVTFVAIKQGFFNAIAKDLTGRVSVAHIGLPSDWIDQWVQRRRESAGE